MYPDLDLGIGGRGRPAEPFDSHGFRLFGSASAAERRGTHEGTASMAIGTGHRVEEIAQDLFELVTQICLSTLRGRRRGGDLKEVEFLTLSTLQAHGTM